MNVEKVNNQSQQFQNGELHREIQREKRDGINATQRDSTQLNATSKRNKKTALTDLDQVARVLSQGASTIYTFSLGGWSPELFSN